MLKSFLKARVVQCYKADTLLPRALLAPSSCHHQCLSVGFILPFKVSVSQPNGSSCPVLKIRLPVKLLLFLFQHPVTPTSSSCPG